MQLQERNGRWFFFRAPSNEIPLFTRAHFEWWMKLRIATAHLTAHGQTKNTIGKLHRNDIATRIFNGIRVQFPILCKCIPLIFAVRYLDRSWMVRLAVAWKIVVATLIRLLHSSLVTLQMFVNCRTFLREKCTIRKKWPGSVFMHYDQTRCKYSALTFFCVIQIWNVDRY